ncbi:MAG: UvrB/UvrC motif-containing protein [Phycisphaerae bacterium]
MLCDKCGKNQATIHMAEFISGKRRNIHLCEDCMKKAFSSNTTNLSLEDILGSMIDSIRNKTVGRELGKKGLLSCPMCGEHYDEFTMKTELGCPEDYFVFHNHILDLLKTDLDEPVVHKGKFPTHSHEKTVSENMRISLTENLEKALEVEDYEAAANLRDRLRGL